MSDKGENNMGVTKPIRPMNVQFDTQQDAEAFDRWAMTKEKSNNESAKRVRARFKAYKEIFNRMK